MSKRLLTAALAAAAVTVGLAGCDPTMSDTHRRDQPPHVSTAGAPSRAQVLRLLDQVQVVDKHEDVNGYDRDTSFGPEWTDEHHGLGGHNDCDTRDDILTAQLTDVELDSDECTVLAGTLDDPYTGKTVHFTKADAIAVQIDHIVPLKYAWDMGAAAWTDSQRIDFANDQQLNLLASDGPTNASKGDDGPGEWLPPNRAFHCTYTARFLRVVIAYQLAIADEDEAAIRDVANTHCPRGGDRR